MSINIISIVPKNNEDITVIHAPTNQIIKATPLVNAAIKRLKIDGYKFKYEELRNLKNIEILNKLEKSHIVLVQFYCLMPGILGIEALSKGNAVLMSASTKLNPELPNNVKDAWLITHYYEIYNNLKYLLDNS